ncbi:ShlB/FhaC/HecB family hemolysin secretion/activation protein [Campylobacter majalis]|uniref:ShlB/FhaC/HecB family hemolysin secretion/activation protein n=1 Tax=Campylobacter majalis TaxID=2790656 RepID=UPI003D697DDD
MYLNFSVDSYCSKETSRYQGSFNLNLNFTIAFGYFNLSYTNSRYSYSQIIAGANRLYEYSAKSTVF